MRKGWLYMFLLFLAGLLNAEIKEASQEGISIWTRRVIPLPHEFSVKKEVVLSPSDISLKLRTGAGDVEKTGFAELENLFREKTGEVPSGKKFLILIGVLDDKGAVEGRKVGNAVRLKSLPNNQQAYIIESQGENTIIVAGLNERGVYYGIRTLYQLLEMTLTPDKAIIPLVSVVDWPDFDERGVWNFMTDEYLPWYASYKLNFSHLSAGLVPNPVKREENVRVRDMTGYLKRRHIRAFVEAFSITHLNFLDRYFGLYQAYPELAGKGEKAWQKANPHPQHRVPCATNPLMVKVLTEIMESAAEQGARDFSVWLSEFTSQCECEECMKTGQSEAETYAAISAWKKVREKYPDFVLRIFYAITPPKDKIIDFFSKIPIEVKLERCGQETVSIKPRYVYANPGFDEFAARGGWVATYDAQVRTYDGRWFFPHDKGFCHPVL